MPGPPSDGLPIRYRSVHVVGSGLFLPGPPIGNDAIDRYIAPLNRSSERVKRRVLQDNGIETRHYAIDEQGETVVSAAEMAAHAVRACVASSGTGLDAVTLLTTGSSGGDTAMPGFANMLAGELRTHPVETSSHHGVCAAGIAAMKTAANAVELGQHRRALVASSEFPSRLFKRSRFAPREYDTDFDSHFLRWMLSDGAGAVMLADEPRADGPSLRLDWIHSRSFSGDFPVCMQVGHPAGGSRKSYLDYPSLADAEKDGAFLLRQDVRLIPHLFDVGIHEYAALARGGYCDPARVDHFLCHYSSEKFAGVIEDLMTAAGLSIPRERWYSNLRTRGNTGAASLFVLLADFLRERAPAPGQRILAFVPESARFTTSFLHMEVVGPARAEDAAPPPHDPRAADDPRVARVLLDLASVWQEYRSRAWRTRLVRKIVEGRLTTADYLRWMESWIPQVRQGTRWMRTAAAHLSAPYDDLRPLIEAHASDEQLDYTILFDDYRAAGGTVADIDALRRNKGGEALDAFMNACANRPNPVDLLGAVYVIEGTGQRIIPALLPMIRRRLPLPAGAFRFLGYHGENDAAHLARWLQAVSLVVARAPDARAAESIVETAAATARLYELQMEYAS